MSLAEILADVKKYGLYGAGFISFDKSSLRGLGSFCDLLKTEPYRPDARELTHIVSRAVRDGGALE